MRRIKALIKSLRSQLSNTDRVDKNKQHLYIHIGMPKTGSSAIQAFLALNEDFLLKNHCQYPNHTGFKQAFQTSAGNVADMAKWIENNNQFALTALLNNTSEEKIILSSEIMFMALKKYPQQFAHLLKGKSFTIICYIRPFADLIESCMNQQIKNHFRVNLKDVDQFSSQFNYYDCLLNALRYFDNRSIVVKKYHHGSFHGGSIYADFMQTLGIELDDTIIHPNKVVNPSLNRDALALRIIMNKVLFAKDDVNLKYRFNGMLAKYSVQSDQMPHDIPLLNKANRISLNKKNWDKEKQFMSRFFKEMDPSQPLFPSEDLSLRTYTDLNLNRLTEIFSFILNHDGELYDVIVDFCHNKIKNHIDKSLLLSAINSLKTVAKD